MDQKFILPMLMVLLCILYLDSCKKYVFRLCLYHRFLVELGLKRNFHKEEVSVIAAGGLSCQKDDIMREK